MTHRTVSALPPPMKFAVVGLVLALVCAVSVFGMPVRLRKAPFPASQAKEFDASLPLDHRVPPFRTHWFTQTLDHFSFANTKTFQQRYLVAGT